MSNKPNKTLMKQHLRFFAMLLLVALASTSAQARDWNIPAPQPSAFVEGDTFAVRNVGMQLFIHSAEAWGTQATVSTDENALANGKFYYVCPKATSDDTFGAGYVLYDNSKGWGTYSHCIWRQPEDGQMGNGIKGCFVDNGTTKPFTQKAWTITEVSTNKYTISVPATCTEELNVAEALAYVEGEVLGVQLDHPSSWAANNADGVTYGIYYDVVYADQPANCQWEFINKKDLDIFTAKHKLAKLIDEEAEPLGIDATAEAALVNNPNATLAELNAAYDSLLKRISAADQYNHPTDVTKDYIFNNNPYQGGSDGWTVVDGSGEKADIGSSSKHGNLWIGEFWNAAGYKLSTKVTLPAGIYRMRAIALTRTNMKSTFQAGDASTLIVTIDNSVNSRAQAAAWFDAGNGVNDIMLLQGEEKEVEISITSDATTGDHWTVWRTFHILDCGASLDSYKKALADYCSNDWKPEFDGATYTESYYDAVDVAFNAASAGNFNSEAEVMAAYNKVMDALRDLRQNIADYKKIKNLLDEDGDIYNSTKYDDSFESFEDFAEVWFEATNIFDTSDFTQTNEYLEDLYDRYVAARQQLINDMNDRPTEGREVDVLVNPSFKDKTGTQSSFEGWTVASSSSFQNNAGSVPVIEQWNSNSSTGVIDVYQMVNIPFQGAYKLVTKGWYRSTTTKATHDSEPAYMNVNTYLYAAASQYKFHDIYDHPYTAEEKEQYFPNGNSFEQDGNIYPNNCTGANELFNHPDVDWYDMEAEFLAFGEPVKLGVKGKDIPGYGWLIWDDMKVIYLGDTPEIMRPIAQYAANDANYLLDEKMAEATRDALLACIDGINNGTTKEELLTAYKNIGAAKEAAEASIEAYKKLQKELDKLNDLINKYGSAATPEAQSKADEVYNKYNDMYENGSIKDEDIDAAIAEMIKAGKGLLMPANIDEGSDSNPIEVTQLITNPTYFEDFTSTLNGWTNVDGKAGVMTCEDVIGYAEGWNTSFDLYQDIEGLPEGTYRVTVDGLYRQQNSTVDLAITQKELADKYGKADKLGEDYNTYVTNPDADRSVWQRAEIPAYDPRGRFYANNDTAVFHRWADVANFDDAAKFEFSTGDDSHITFIDSISSNTPQYYYFPTVRPAVYQHALGGFYANELYVTIAAGETLRIGACNKAAVGADWVPFSNWRLFYLGKDSEHKTDGIEAIEERSMGEIQAIYTIDGRRINALQRGLNIVVRNGKAQKILVK